jgi:hypothetical protein
VQLASEVHPLHEAPEFAGHAVHVPPLGPYRPELHLQLTKAVHPLHEAPEFAGHAVQLPPLGP